MVADGATVYVLTDARLWRADGVSGTLVRDLSIGATYQQSASNLAVAGGRVFFGAKTGNESRNVLWVSDGTTAGTVPVTRTGGGFVYTGAGGSNGSSSIVAVGERRVYLPAAPQPFDPFELWVSDGTAGGTALVFDLWPGEPSSNPGFLTHAHGRLLFAADDGLHGRELWSLDVGANSQAAGYGCAADGRPPRLSAGDPVLGTTLQFDAASPRAATRGVLGLGIPTTPPALHLADGCWIPVDYGLPAVLVFFTTDGQGAWRLAVPVPNDPTLIGLDLAAQVGIDAPATPPLGLDLSNALLLRAGR
jgi:ELWxxDGT repeat protein